jgi:hypothetical protein
VVFKKTITCIHQNTYSIVTDGPPLLLGQRLDFLAPELNRGALICSRVTNQERGGIASKHFRTWAPRCLRDV